MAERPRSAASSIYPNLPHDDGRNAQWATQRRDRTDVAAALYPDRTPKPQPSAPKPRMTREQIFDWSDVDPAYARAVGFVPKGRR
jgi:hypothetical protein